MLKISEVIIRKQSSALIWEKDRAVIVDVMKNFVDTVVLRYTEEIVMVPRRDFTREMNDNEKEKELQTKKT